MELKDLKLPKKSKKELTSILPVNPVGDRYPYGFVLRLEDEELGKFPKLQDVKKGAKVSLQAIGEVTSWRKSDEKGGKARYSIEIQLQKVGIETSSDKKDTLIGAIEKSKKGQE